MHCKTKRLFCCLLVFLFLMGLPPSALAAGMIPAETLPAQIPGEAAQPMAEENYIWFQGYVYRAEEDAPNFQKTYTLTDGTHTASVHHLYVMRLRVNGSWQVAYCIEPDTGVYPGIDYGDGSDVGVSGDWKVHLTRNQQQAIGLVMLYSALHHPDTLSSVESVEWEAATQIMIWEIVTGMRSSAAPYACMDTGLIDQFTGSVRYSDGEDYTLSAIRAKYDILSGELAVHSVIPSFTGSSTATAPVHTMRQTAGGYSLTLTDANGVLEHYPFASQAGVTLTQSGNTLTAEAASGAWQELTFTASRKTPQPDSASCFFRLFYLDENNQTLASPPGRANIPTEPVRAYFKIAAAEQPGTAAIQKTAGSGSVEGYCFKVWQANGNKTWYGKSDASGRVYRTDSGYNQAGTKSYTFSGLLDGEFSFREAISRSSRQDSHPVSWRFVVTDKNGKVTVDKTLEESQLIRDGADFLTPRVTLTGLTGGGKLTMTIHNAPNTAPLEILKTSDDGKVSGISFLVEHFISGSGYQLLGTYTTDGSGKISIPGLSVGTTLRVTETVPQNYTAEKKTQIITIQEGTNTMTFVNHYMLADLEILKTSPDGKVDGITFTVTDSRGNVVGSGVTDRDGRLIVPGLTKGVAYTVEETVPEGYVCDNPRQTVIICAGTNTVTFENRPIYGNLELTKIDESNPEIKLSGAEFTVTREISSEDPSLGSAIREQVMPEVLDADGHGTGVYRLEHLRYGRYTLRETKAPEGYELSNEVFTIDITEDGKTYTVSSSGFDGVPNRQQVGSVQVKKVDPEGNPLAGVSFLLEYSQDGKNWKSVTFREEGSLPVLGGCTSAGLTDGVLVTGEDGTALFSGLSITIGENRVFYRLTETAAPEGYSLLAKPAFEGELPQDGSRDITVTVVNTPQFGLPFTGNTGFTTVTFGLLLTELALCAAVSLFRRKRKEA